MRKLFRPCATLRLFLPDLLPDLTSVIYLDTDIIFLESLSKLWAEFNNFRSVTLSALAPCLFHYGTPRNLVPYYGESGLNAGLMLMNLSRMRESRWTNKIRNLVPIFRSQIKLADQVKFLYNILSVQ
jgi:UDP-xylose:glucoside alpha-1,3-xylosyltransferase